MKKTNVVYAPVKETILFFNTFYSQKLSKAHRQRVSAVFPQIMSLNIFQGSSSSRFFEALLGLTAADDRDEISKSKRSQVLELLTRSLCYDGSCFTLWRNIYPAYVPGSNNLLRHIAENWGTHDGEKGGLPEMNKRTTLHRSLVAFIKHVDDSNELLLSGKYESQTGPSGTILSPQKLGITKETVGVITATCHLLEKAIGAEPVPEVGEGGERRVATTQGSNKIRSFFTLLMLLLIAVIYFYEIEFSDLRHFVKDFGKAKLGL